MTSEALISACRPRYRAIVNFHAFRPRLRPNEPCSKIAKTTANNKLTVHSKLLFAVALQWSYSRSPCTYITVRPRRGLNL